MAQALRTRDVFIITIIHQLSYEKNQFTVLSTSTHIVQLYQEGCFF